MKRQLQIRREWTTYRGDEKVAFAVLLVFPLGSGGVWDGISIFVRVSRNQTVLDVAAANTVCAQKYQRLSPVRRQLHNLEKHTQHA